MNETIKTLLTRRSIRKYKPEQIKDEELELILEAGKYAPTGRNWQSPIFIVVQNKEVLKKLSEMNAKIFGREGDPYFGAPTVVLVLADRSRHTAVEDGSVALCNMFNAAASLGIGSCWVNREKEMFETEEGKALLKEWGIEGDYIGVGACTLGYPDCKHPEPFPRKSNYVYYVR
jgi:nitroreductase